MLGAARKSAGTGWCSRLSAAVSGLFFGAGRVHGRATVHERLRATMASAESMAAGTARESTALAHGVHADPGHPGRGWPGRVPGLATRVPGPETLVSPGADDGENPCIHMGAADLVGEFVAYMLTADCRIALDHKAMLAQYWRWAREFRVHRIPDTIFLAQLGRHPEVRKGRERAKDKQGRVVRLDTDARSPKRPVVYIIGESKRARRTLPGTVPVADLVKTDPVLTRNRAAGSGLPAAAPQPAQSDQPAQPLRRAA